MSVRYVPPADSSHSFIAFSTKLLQYYEEDEEGNKTYTEIQDGQRVEMGGIITAATRKTTKSGQSMATITLEDVYGGIECVFFPKNYDKYKQEIRPELIVSVSGRLQIRDGQKPSISVEKMKEMEIGEEENSAKKTAAEKKTPEKTAGTECLGVIIPDGGNAEAVESEVLETLALYPGEIPVFIKKQGKYYKTGVKVRKCNGLVAELEFSLPENNVVFFTR